MSFSTRVLKAAFEVGYTVDLEQGVVISPTGRALPGSVNTVGYRVVSLYVPDLTPQKGTQLPVHRLVAFAKFGDEMFVSGLEVRHRDNNKLNNVGSNILLGTRSENMLDLPKEQRSARSKGKPSPKRVLSASQVSEIKDTYAAGIQRGDTKRLAEKFNIATSTVSAIGKGKTYAI